MIKEAHETANIFPDMEDKDYQALIKSIKETGQQEPVVMYQGLILDGRHRARACEALGINCITKEYTGNDPLTFVLNANLHRRHLTPIQLGCIGAEIAKLRQGYRKDYATDMQNCISVKTRDEVAKAIGVSKRTIASAAHIKKHGTKELFEDVKAGKVKPKEAEEILKQQRNTSPVFNFTNDNIEWAKWSWNPMTGCKHGCAYCYARDIAMRFDGTFEPKFRKERLLAPSNTKIPSNLINSPGINTVFVCSMADLFGDWVDQKHIQQILDVCEKTPQWTYILLTKNPKRYAQFKFPANCWAGATVDTQARVDSTYEGLLECDAPIRFVSCEPLKGPIGFPENMPINWLIIGGQSKSVGEPAFQPEWQWVEDLMIQAWRLEIPVYWKPNLTVRPKEYPNV